MSFVHLRTHTEYSVVDGTLRVDEAVGAAALDGQAACAITDLSNLFGAIKFYTAAGKKGVKPIIGCDLWLEPEEGDKHGSRLLVLVQNHQGYLNLCELLARAWSGNTQRSHAFVKWDWFETHGAGLLVLSGADGGAVGQALLAGDADRAEAIAQRLAALFPQRFFIELQRAGLASNERHVRAAVPLAAKLKLPVVATHPVQFLEPDDFEAHEARVCVAEGETLANPKRVKRFSREQYFKTQAQMEALFADLPVAVSNSVAIAQRCNLLLTLGKPQLPDFPTPRGVPVDQHFREASHAGLEVRLAQLYPDVAKREAERARYVQRLDFELDTIIQMGFPGYFLIVADFIQWAKSHGCPVGPGRGSGAGSLVAYSLLITDLDPLQYNLLFERFLNPERVSMPDFDIDFCQANRERVIDYVKDKYGRDAVSQIATFGTMAAKAALRDVGRVLGMGYGHVDSIAKLVVAPPGKTVTLAKVPEHPIEGILYARKEEPEIDRREAAEEEVAELLSLATRVEGIVRNVGMHAGGVLIAPGKITDFCPLYQQPGSDSAVSQFDKDDVEAIGLVKFDFLGLATLTILELAKEMVRARRKGRENFDYAQLPLDDAATYRIFAEGKTEAVFQFESRGMVGMLREAKPTRLEDLIALNAMFRPGPMENIPMFCRRKNGLEPIEYPHPLLEGLLSETYGIFVYQEQVMQAAQVLADYSLGGADLLRRAMGKKNAEEMAKQRQIFREGASKNVIDQPKADEVFDLMEKFAGYGFNKSHAAAYALLAYHTGWLKAHCTAEFYAANMTVELDNTDKLKVLLADAKQFGVSFEPPDVNRGGYRFEPVSDTVVRYGLCGIKGTGQGAIEAIIAVRDGSGDHQGEGSGPFRSLFDFAARIDRQRVNKRVVEALIKAGAFDVLHPDRASALASVGLAFDWADTQDVNEHQGGLFDFDDSHAASTQEPALVKAEPWSIKERLTAEKAALGFYLSGHLFEEYAPEVRQFCKRQIADLVDTGREPQVLAGIVSDLRVVNGARGRTAIFRLDDGSEYIEAVASEELYDANRERLRDDELVVIQGRVQNDRFSGGLRLQCNVVWDLPSARARFGRYLSVAVNGKVPPVADVIKTWPPKCVLSEHGQTQQGLPIRLQLQRERAEGVLDLGDQARFWPSDEALARWRTLAHEGRAAVVYE
jgi:DNA polymerase III subunit alpha